MKVAGSGGGALRRPLVVGVGMLLCSQLAHAQAGPVVKELLPFRFSAVRSLEIDATVNGVRRTDLDIRRATYERSLSGRAQVTDGGIAGPCGDDPSDARRRWEYALQPASRSHGLAFAAKIRVTSRLGGTSTRRAACPVSDVRRVDGEARLGITLTSEQPRDSGNHGARWLVLFDTMEVGPSARAHRANGPWLEPETWTNGGALYAAGDAPGDVLWLGLRADAGTMSSTELAGIASKCGPCDRGSWWPRGEFYVTTLGHAIQAAGLSAVVENRGRATIDVEVPLDSFLVTLDAATHQRSVWNCDVHRACDIPDGHLAVRDLRLSGSGERASLTMRVQRRQTALSNGWGPVYAAEAIVSAGMAHESFMLLGVDSVAVPGADPTYRWFLQEGLRTAVNYRLFPSFTGSEGYLRPFKTVCLFPVTHQARVQAIATGATLRLQLDAPVNITMHFFCPRTR